MSFERAGQSHDDTAILVENVAKEFRFYDRPTDRLKELLWLNRRRYHTIKRALGGVSFSVQHGESVGVMGRNGAGKTTLLSILTGTMAPTSGTVDVYGRVGAILGLGVGFMPQYSGRENLRNGLIALGVPPREIRRKEAEVIEFSELEEAIDDPLRTYSSGMTVRLGFSLAISFAPDILIVDEALAVGDAAFQLKCQHEIRRFIEAGKTLFFVSHNTGTLEATCQRGIFLEQGRVVFDGAMKDALREYRLRDLGRESVVPKDEAASDGDTSAGDANVVLVRAEIRDAAHIRDNVFEMHQGETARMRVTARTPTPIERPALGVVVQSGLGKEVCGYSTVNPSVPVPRIGPGEFGFDVRVPLNVRPGMYTFSVTIYDLATAPPRLVRAWENVCAIRVRSAGYRIRGLVDPGIEIEYGSAVYSLRAEQQRRLGTSSRGG
jgi:lipopolysaccharide transport system ATP-binding protein